MIFMMPVSEWPLSGHFLRAWMGRWSAFSIGMCRSFAGEALERERFGADVVASYKSGLSFAKAKANVESINRWAEAT